MVNNRTKSYLRFGMSLIAIAFFLTTCEKDNFNEEEALEATDGQPPISIKTIDITEAGETFDHLKDRYKLKNHLGIQHLGNTQQKNATEAGNAPNIVIYTDEVREITQGDYTSYTMKIASLDDDPNTFYNITIEDKNGNEGMFVTQYKKESSDGDVQNKRISSISTERINDITEPLDPEDFDGGGSETFPGGSGGGGSDNTLYPYDCEGTVITTYISVGEPCGQGHMPWDPNHDWTYGSNDPPRHPSSSLLATYECWETGIGDIEDPVTGNPDTSGPGGGNDGVGGGSGNPLNDSLTSPVGTDDDEDECLANGNNLDVCECLANGGTVEDCVLIDEINDCINGSSTTDNTTIPQEILDGVDLSTEQWTAINSYLTENDCSEDAQEAIIEYLEDEVSFPYPHCSSFEYAQPAGESVKACAVTNLGDSFWASVLNPDGSWGLYNIEVNYPIIYFTMPNWMTNGQAATLTAIAVNESFNDVSTWFQGNPTANEYELGLQLDLILQTRMIAIGGTWTIIPPFNIPSPAPYVTSIWGTGNCY